RIRTESGMAPQHLPAAIDDVARGTDTPRLLAQEFPVVPSRHEADVLAVGLVGVRQATPRGDGPHLLLAHLAERKDRHPELLLAEIEEKVRLVPLRIFGTQQLPPAGLVAAGAGVVARGHEGSPQRPGA